jgi:hypothetical protein
MPLWTIYHGVIKFYATVLSCYDKGIILRPQFNVMLFIKGVLNIRDSNTAVEKYSMLYINVLIFRIHNVV